MKKTLKLKDLVPGAAPEAAAPTKEQLEAQIKAEMQKRSDACLEELRDLLKKHRCEILAMPMIQDGSVVAGWGVRAL